MGEIKLKMKSVSRLRFTVLLGMLFLILPLKLRSQDTSQLKLWYDKPAEKWVEALPVGNGRLGAMVYGDPREEVIQLNENTVWAGDLAEMIILKPKNIYQKYRNFFLKEKAQTPRSSSINIL